MKKNSMLALLLAMAMVFTVCMPVMAEEATTPAGTLFVPYKGQMSAVDLGAAFSITDNTAGVFKSGSTLLLDGDLTKAGSVTVNETAMQVSPYVLYEDFEDGTVGNAVSTTKIEKLSASAEDKSMFASTSTALIAGDSSNKYADGNGDYSDQVSEVVVVPLDGLSASSYNGKVTISAKIRRNNGDAAVTEPGIKVTNANGNTLINFRFLAATTSSRLFTKVSSDGASVGSNGTSIGGVNTNTWIDAIFELDLATGTYDFTIGGNKGTGYKMLNSPTNVSLGTIQFGVRTDNIAVYSGTSYEATNTITGTDTIYAPKAGSFAKVDGYKVVGSEETVIENAVISLADSYTGMQLKNDALIFSNDVEAGDKYLVATDANGNFLAKGVINVASDVYYEDFEDGTTGESATGTKLEKLDGTDSDNSFVTATTYNSVIATYGSNQYADGDALVAGATGVRSLNLALQNSLTGKVTVSAKIMVDGENGGDLLTFSNSAGTRVLAMRYSTTNHRLTTKQNKDGSYIATGNTTDMEQVFNFTPGEWAELKFVIDFDKKTYDVFANEELIIDDFAVSEKLTDNFNLGKLQFYYDVDEVSVYSGAPYRIVADKARFVIPAIGENSYTVTAKYNDGTAVSNLVCTTATAGASASGNTVNVSYAAAVAPVTVTLSDGFVTGTATFEVDKNFVLVNGTEFAGDSALTSGSNTIYAVYGASDMPQGNIIYIARYSKNGELIALENFAKSATTAQVIDATLTDSFNTGDIAKVFIWKNGTLVPLGNAVEIR